MRPSNALSEAARILIEHFGPVAQFSEVTGAIVPEEVEEIAGGQFADVPIEDIELSMRAYNCLKRASIVTIGDIMDRLDKGAAEMLAIRSFGQKSLDELVEQMKVKGFIDPDYVVGP